MNIHIITGPNGMCRCGEGGKTCAEIISAGFYTTSLLRGDDDMVAVPRSLVVNLDLYLSLVGYRALEAGKDDVQEECKQIADKLRRIHETAPALPKTT